MLVKFILLLFVLFGFVKEVIIVVFMYRIKVKVFLFVSLL